MTSSTTPLHHRPQLLSAVHLLSYAPSQSGPTLVQSYRAATKPETSINHLLLLKEHGSGPSSARSIVLPSPLFQAGVLHDSRPPPLPRSPLQLLSTTHHATAERGSTIQCVQQILRSSILVIPVPPRELHNFVRAAALPPSLTSHGRRRRHMLRPRIVPATPNQADDAVCQISRKVQHVALAPGTSPHAEHPRRPLSSCVTALPSS